MQAGVQAGAGTDAPSLIVLPANNLCVGAARNSRFKPGLAAAGLQKLMCAIEHTAGNSCRILKANVLAQS